MIELSEAYGVLKIDGHDVRTIQVCNALSILCRCFQRQGMDLKAPGNGLAFVTTKELTINPQTFIRDFMKDMEEAVK
jgi:hypothetical protein